MAESRIPAAPVLETRDFAARLRRLGVGRGDRLLAAFSGGLDSTVLLHLLCALRDALGYDLEAVHVDHGLHPDSERWRAHCQARCRDWRVPCRVVRPVIARRPGQSLEAVAREARYRCLADLLGPGDAAVTAHHRDDQAETVLLMLLRGAGPAGLAAMPWEGPLGPGRLLRPLLDTPRAALRAYAESRGLGWLEDPSNADLSRARNRLRHAVLPVLRQGWPGAARALAATAGHCAEAAQLLEERAREDLEACRTRYTGLFPPPWPVLSAPALAALDGARRRNLLRHWLAAAAGRPPPARLLAVLERDLLGCRPSGLGRLDWQGLALRRYRDQLVLMPPWDGDWAERGWDLAAPLEIPEAGLRLVARRAPGGLDPARLPGGGLRVRPRRGGERLRPAGRAGRHPLKKLYQEAGIPPWERTRLPLLWAGDEPVAVAGLWVSEAFACVPPAAGLHVQVAGRDPSGA